MNTAGDELNKPWLKNYPAGVPQQIDISRYNSLLDLFSESFTRFSQRKAYQYFGQALTFSELDQASQDFAAYLQSLGLERGARVAIMLPNVLQYPIAMLGILRAGFVVVNINPLYTPRELEYQLQDSGASVLIILENFAHVYQSIEPQMQLKQVIVTSIGELIGIKGWAIDFVLRHVKKVVPAWHLEGSIAFKSALHIGAKKQLQAVQILPADIAFLQYTGGTTGVSKGAVLSHRNILANMLQVDVWLEPALTLKTPAGATVSKDDQLVFLCALPLYHIFALTACALVGIQRGALNILVPNPKDIAGFIQLLAKNPSIHLFPVVNTLLAALLRHPNFAKLQFPNLLVTIGGGMAVQKNVADLWQQMTGVPVAEGYGLSETAPVACVNTPLIKEFTGHIGLPLPSTEIQIRGDDGLPTALGEPGEICIRGPQVMVGYWNRPQDTREAMTTDGFFKSGDIGMMNADGYVKIIDRKKDMIIVSGFKVYPNEIEALLMQLDGVMECAVIGVPDEETGEAVKLFVVQDVTADPSENLSVEPRGNLTEEGIQNFCKAQLTNYKRPKYIVFKESLPKTNLGKILRRELRQ
ncbi:AMP-binding protein [Polynucleobacter sp. IMCC 30228]|uniref:AMP-binding protein n=1 Tax=Polynucleobacter sp. IMCC 30228 TaxID=2781011 RepID=UPI001F1776CF|nr:AMP-binding protein [Polynucleobacter sp. IMCC 30228]MCE7527940.1 AMP-binding protein [Polynucleobacter sp. IMCC 30228]